MRHGALLASIGPDSFNPRICKRCDASRLAVRDQVSVSIHASVKDATRIYGHIKELTGFNPRICKRCDAVLYGNLLGPKVSIHASVKDATKRQKRAIAAQKVSIHASVKDATKTG